MEGVLLQRGTPLCYINLYPHQRVLIKMKYFSIVDGKAQDWSWKSRDTDTVFYIGKTMVGQLFKNRKNKWSAVHRLPSTLDGPVHGFSSRLAASIYLDQLERAHSSAADNLNKAHD